MDEPEHRRTLVYLSPEEILFQPVTYTGQPEHVDDLVRHAIARLAWKLLAVHAPKLFAQRRRQYRYHTIDVIDGQYAVVFWREQAAAGAPPEAA